MSDQLMITLIHQRNDSILLEISNEIGALLPNSKTYKACDVMKLLRDCEKIMQNNKIEYGIRLVNFIKYVK